MPRRRMIDPEIWRNERFGSLPDAGRLLFIGIFSQADDDGRLKASPASLMATIFPYDKDKSVDDIKRLRDQCADLGLIRLYTSGRQEYLDIPGWLEHQRIRKDRYQPSKLSSFEDSKEILTTAGNPSGNQVATAGKHSIGEGRLVKSSTGTPPKGGARKKRAVQTNPEVKDILDEMKKFLGYSEVCGGEAVPAIEENPAKTADRRIDPIPNYGKEGKAIKRMLARGFTREEILTCWRSKVSQRGGDFVSMQWVNEDIGKKGGTGGADKERAVQGEPEGKWDSSKPLPRKPVNFDPKESLR